MPNESELGAMTSLCCSAVPKLWQINSLPCENWCEYSDLSYGKSKANLDVNLAGTASVICKMISSTRKPGASACIFSSSEIASYKSTAVRLLNFITVYLQLADLSLVIPSFSYFSRTGDTVLPSLRMFPVQFSFFLSSSFFILVRETAIDSSR